MVDFSCHVGHRYTAEALMNAQDGNIESALWTAVRALEEKGKLRRKMAKRALRSVSSTAPGRHGGPRAGGPPRVGARAAGGRRAADKR